MIYFVDIDDTICFNNNDKTNYRLAKPSNERIKKINDLFDKGNTIIYWTARGTLTGINWFDVTIKQLNEWNCKYNELRMGKPYYDIFIDDKNINSDIFFNTD